MARDGRNRDSFDSSEAGRGEPRGVGPESLLKHSPRDWRDFPGTLEDKSEG